MAVSLLWATSASLLVIVGTVVADENLPLSCVWLSTVVDGCADDSFVFPDFTGWGILKRHFQACLYIRGDVTPPFTCQDDTRLQRIVSCKAEAYNNARESLHEAPNDQGISNFQTCVTDTLSKYKGSPIVVGSSIELTADLNNTPSPVIGHVDPSRDTQSNGSGSRPNITIEYTHYQ